MTERHAILLVVVEPGARLPSAVDEERRARPESVVTIAGGALRADEFAFRAVERIAKIPDSGHPVDRAIFVVRPGKGDPLRSLLARALIARLGEVGVSELVVTADRPANGMTREALLELAAELVALPEARRMSVRVRLDGDTHESGVWPRLQLLSAMRQA